MVTAVWSCFSCRLYAVCAEPATHTHSNIESRGLNQLYWQYTLGLTLLVELVQCVLCMSRSAGSGGIVLCIVKWQVHAVQTCGSLRAGRLTLLLPLDLALHALHAATSAKHL
jgi:hypothetical protein